MQKDCVIYTCLTGGYDQLQQPQVVDPAFDYVCYTNDFKEEQIGAWKILPIPFSHKDPLVTSRYVKLMPHKVLSEYPCSVWMDANIVILGERFYDYVKAQMDDRAALIAHVNHVYEERACTYDEIEACLHAGKIGLCMALRQYTHLRRNHFPRNQGLFENNLIFRRHMDPFVQRISEAWWSEFLQYAHRDQLSLNYLYWKASYRPNLLLAPGESARNVDYLAYIKHSKQQDLKSLYGILRKLVLIPVSCFLYRLLARR